MYTLHHKSWYFTALFAVLLLLTFSTAEARSTISGRYVSVSGKTIVLSLNVNTSGPSNLIVDQQFGSGNTIISTSPTAQKVNNKSGRVKWLFRNVSPGSLTLTVRLKNQLKGKPTATVKYRAPGSGGFEEMRISP